MTGTIHKLTAGTGYEYLTRQVAAMDATDKGKVSLADYYSAKGESPGRWMGSGLSALAASPAARVAGADTAAAAPVGTDLDADRDPAHAARVVTAGDTVSAEQMKALFGEGRHPNADAITAAMVATGATGAQALEQSQLGASFGDYTAQPDFIVALAVKFREHNKAVGNRWNDPIDPETRARLRTELGTERFTEQYGRAPRDDRELSSFLVTASRKDKQNAVAGYDMTFTPVKSVSALWAIAPMDMSAAIEECHDRAVADAVAFLEREACFSRIGGDGVAQVSTDGLIAAAFTHRDSRNGDPNLHTHVTISNKVRVEDITGQHKWMALDGRPLFKATVAASEVYNSRAEMYMATHPKLGVQFAERASADTRKRPIREIVGIPEKLCEAWSSRRAQIEVRTAELSRQFQADHGREPTSSEAFDLAQQATLDTRNPKHEPRSMAEQRQMWAAQGAAVLGAVTPLPGVVASATGHTRAPRAADVQHLTDTERERFAATAIETVTATRARFQRNHIRAEAERLLRAADSVGLASDAAVSAAVEAITDTAFDPDHAVAASSDALDGDLGEPEVMRRPDGASVYTTHDTALFTTTAILAAERRIVAASRRADGQRLDDTAVDIALLEQAANGRELNPGQADMVRALATEGRRVHPVIAPAGTGKTTALATLGSAWSDADKTIVGLAPTAAAAKVLEAELGVKTDTLAKLVQLVHDERWYADQQELAATPRWKTAANRELREQVETARAGLASGTIKAPNLPDWYRELDDTSLVIIDEAGMAGTADLDTAISHILSVGGKVCPVGDDQQLSSISAGGVMRDLAYETGALTLTQVMRFADPGEGAASLAVRDGDAAGLGYYADHGRIHVAADAVATDQAYTAWAADRADGRDTHMLAATRDTVNELNARARADRLAAHPDAPRASVGLADGLQAGVGDIICSRRNKRSLRISATDWVRNGDRWKVTAVGADGSLTAQHLDLNRSIDIPADYVADNVTLGYASTIHGAQGLTADTCHIVGSDMLTRQLLYVAMTRGRHGNHIYFSTAETDPHNLTTPKAVTPSTGLETLTAILARDDAQQSATTAARVALDPFTRLQRAAGNYVDAVGSAAEHTLGADALAALERDADTIYTETTGAAPNDRLTAAPAWPTLRKHLATIEIDGGDARDRLRAAITSRELDTADDVAAVLDWRLDTTAKHGANTGPLPWQPAIPKTLAADETWGDYLSARAGLVTDLADQISETAIGWTIADAPRWARPFVAAAAATDTDASRGGAIVGDLAVMRAALGVDEVDRRPVGPDHPMLAIRRAQRTLATRAAAVVDTSSAPARWSELAASIDRHIVADPYWPELAEQLSVAARAGLDVHTLARDAVPADNPLPTEMPAAALWFRLSAELAPASLDVAGTGQRPDWINALPGIVGDRAAQAIIADPAWPGLVAAVDAADPQQWSAPELLALADELLRDGGDDDTVRLDEYARALTWRIDLITAHPHLTAPLPDDAPPSVADEEAAAALAGVDDPDTSAPTADDLADVAALDATTGDTGVPGGGVDDGYLESLAGTEPPPDYDFEPDYTDEPAYDTFEPVPDPVDDTYPELVFDDFTTTAPLRADRFAPPVDIAAAIADRYEIAAQLADATTARDTYAAAIADGNGPHTLAVAPQIVALRTAYDHQFGAASDLATAHIELTAAQTRLDELTARAADLRARATALRATDTPDLGVGDGDPADITALHLDADATMCDMQIGAATADRDAFAADYTDAQTRLDTAVAESGGRLVTAADIDAIRWTADGLDTDTHTDLRRTVTDLANRLWRIETRLARHHASTETAHRHRATSTPDPRPTTAPPAPEPAAPEQVAAHTGAAPSPQPVVLTGDAALPDAAITAELSTTQRMLTRLDDERRFARRVNPQRGHTADAVAAEHAHLAAQVAPIRAAQAATDALIAAQQKVSATTTALTAARRDLAGARRRDRPAAQARVDALSTDLTRATAAVAAARHTADITAAAVDTSPETWSTVLARAADTDTLATELAAARHEDARTDATDARAAAQRERYTRRAEELRTEQRRRAARTDTQRDAENAARTTSPEPAPHTTSATPTTLPPDLGVDHTPDTGPEL